MRKLAVLGVLSVGFSACGDGGEAARTSPDGRTCSCNGATCGLDNCNESCGSCSGGLVCDDGACEDAGQCDIVGFTATTEAAYAR